MPIKWFELQYLCWECAGYRTAYSTLEDVVHELSDDTDYRPISVCTIEAGLPRVHDFIEWNVSRLDGIEEYDYRTPNGEIATAYSYLDDDQEMVLFIFNGKGY